MSTIFLLGNGKSLNQVDVTLLKDKHTISFNRAYIAYKEWGFDPTYYANIDSSDIGCYHADIKCLINESKIKEFFLRDGFQYLFVNKRVCRIINGQRYYSHLPNVFFIPNYDTKFMDAEIGFGVAFRSIPILINKGYKNIVLLGCDCIYNDGNSDKGNVLRTGLEDNDHDHFRPDYYGKGIEYGIPMPTEDHIRIWKKIKNHLDTIKSPVKIYSAMPDGVLNDVFEYIDFEKSLTI